MSAQARANGWRGFESLYPDRVEGGWAYRCDGLPSLMGCPAHVTLTRKWSTVGRKKAGWLVCYGLEPKTPTTRFDDPDGWEPDPDVVLAYCPSCATVVEKGRR